MNRLSFILILLFVGWIEICIDLEIHSWNYLTSIGFVMLICLSIGVSFIRLKEIVKK